MGSPAPTALPSASPTPVPTPAPTHCPPGEIVLDGRCTPCESGRYASNITWACELCEAGRFQTFSGRASCDRCNPGELSSVNRVYCAPQRPRSFNFNYQTNAFLWTQNQAALGLYTEIQIIFTGAHHAQNIVHNRYFVHFWPIFIGRRVCRLYTWTIRSEPSTR